MSAVQDLDLFSTTNGHGKVMYGFLSLVWVFIANVNIKSERYRIFGDMRFVVSFALHRFDLPILIILVGCVILSQTTTSHFQKSIMILQPYEDEWFANFALVWMRNKVKRKPRNDRRWKVQSTCSGA